VIHFLGYSIVYALMRPSEATTRVMVMLPLGNSQWLLGQVDIFSYYTRGRQMKNSLGIFCQILAPVVAVLGLVPAGLLLNPWRNAELANQLDEIYFGFHLAKAGIIALAGFIAGFILFRAGVHLKTNCRLLPRK
jgi:hypothetical protein